MDFVISDLVSDVNITIKKTWENMGNPKLVWSPFQLILANQHKVIPFGRMVGVPIEVEGIQILR